MLLRVNNNTNSSNCGQMMAMSKENQPNSNILESNNGDTKSAPEVIDHWFRAATTTISSLTTVHKGVENVVHWACEVIHWQELSGENPGSSPAFELAQGLDLDTEESQDFREQIQYRMNACEAFEKITALFARAMRDQWASALSNNVDAMDLRSDQPAVASIIRHAQESACMHPLIDTEIAAKKGWRKAFGRAKWRSFQDDVPLYAYLGLISVAVAPPSEDMEDGIDLVNEEGGELGLRDTLHLSSPIVHPNELDADGLIDNPNALRRVAKKALEMSAVSRDHFAAAIALPRFFSHEELEQVSFQSLHDISQKVIGVLNMGAHENDLENLVLQMLNRGIGGRILSDMDLLASSRIHYLITVIYTQEPDGSQAALKGMGPWPISLEEDDQVHFDKALAPAISAVMDGEMEIAVASLDLFFHTLRDGVRRQRAQAAIDQITMALKSANTIPQDCYYVIDNETDPNLISQALVLNLQNGWFEPIGSVSWPMVNFDDPYDQAAHLKIIAESFGFRQRSDVFLVKQQGFA